MYLEKTSCVIFSGDQNLISGRSPQVVKTKKTRSAAVISFQVVSRRDGCSKVHSRRIWYSMFLVQDAFSLRMLLFLVLWALPLCSLCPAVFQIARATTRLQFTTVPICHDSRLRILTTTRLTTAGCPRPRLRMFTTGLTTTTGFRP